MLGARGSAEPRPSLLVRLTFDDGLVGHAGLCAWPSLGDPPLRTLPSALAASDPPPLVVRAIEVARADAEARAEGRSLFDGLEIPRSHALMTSLDHSRLPEVLAGGFDRLKVKIGRAPESEARGLDALVAAHPELSLRLDANATFDADSFERWWSRLAPSTRAAIELVEDPCPFDPVAWARLTAPLAWDRGSEGLLDRHEELARKGLRLSAIVVKPAIQPADPLADLAARLDLGVVVTSYLGPALEQVASAWIAGRLLRAHPGTIRDCGLCSHTAYETDPWFDRLEICDARLVRPAGTGLGFDGMLAATSWRAPEELMWS